MDRRKLIALLVAIPAMLLTQTAGATGERLRKVLSVLPGVGKRRCRLTLIVDDKLSDDKEGGSWHPMFIKHWSKKLVKDFDDPTLNVECVQCHKTNSRSYQLIINVQERNQ